MQFPPTEMTDEWLEMSLHVVRGCEMLCVMAEEEEKEEKAEAEEKWRVEHKKQEPHNIYTNHIVICLENFFCSAITEKYCSWMFLVQSLQTSTFPQKHPKLDQSPELPEALPGAAWKFWALGFSFQSSGSWVFVFIPWVQFGL